MRKRSHIYRASTAWANVPGTDSQKTAKSERKPLDMDIRLDACLHIYELLACFFSSISESGLVYEVFTVPGRSSLQNRWDMLQPRCCGMS